ncbi:MAG: RNHCP domain-containing protein [Candidatus Gracilibacteria bacterium]
MAKFIVINEGFTCQKCGEKNPPQAHSCRNHCRKCLNSLHVDEEFPGDRASECLSLMDPIGIKNDSKKGWMLIHQCRKCGKKAINKMADDDDFNAIIKLSKIPIDIE